MFHKMVPLNLVLLLLLLNLPVVQDKNQLIIPDNKCQGRPQLFAWFSPGCIAVIAHRNHSFICTNRINLVSKVEFMQVSNF